MLRHFDQLLKISSQDKSNVAEPFTYGYAEFALYVAHVRLLEREKNVVGESWQAASGILAARHTNVPIGALFKIISKNYYRL